nr:hypothetical protein [Tanacetum cinerariifolium]
MSDSKHSTVTYTSVPSSVEYYSDIGSPKVDGPLSPDCVPGPEEPEQAPLSPDYVPGSEEPKQAPLSPDYVPPLPVSGTPTADSPGYILEFDPNGDPKEDEKEDLEEDPADYPANSTVVALPTVDHVLSEEVTEPLPQIPSPPLPIPSPPLDSPTHIEISKSCLPLRKRLHFASPTPSQEVGESLAAGAARQNEPTIARDDPYSLLREEIYGFFDRETTIMYGMMEEAQDDRSQLRGRVNLLYRDRHVHRYLAVMIEREARMARQAWVLSMNARDNAHSDVMSLRTMFVAQHALILDLQAADLRRQGAIKELLATDHKRQVQLTNALRALAACDADRNTNGDDNHNSGTGNALTWWNSHVKTTTPEAAHALPWRTLKKMMTDKYYPRGKIKKLEFKIWNLKVKGTDVVAYSQRFQELALMCDRMFPEEIDKVKKYVAGLPHTIHGSVMATKPKTMQDAIEFATKLMNKINTWAERQADNKRKSDDTTRNNHQQLNKRQNTRRAYVAGNGERKEYAGTLPLCNKCKFQYNGQCTIKCANCKRVGHLTRDCRSPAATNNHRNLTCYECRNQGHYRSDCSELKNQDHGNQARGTEAHIMVHALEGRETNQDLNDMEDDINA